MTNKLSRDEKLKLLKLYFQDNEIIKVMSETLSEKDVDILLYNNLDTILREAVKNEDIY